MTGDDAGTVLVLGGYGRCGARIVRSLTETPGLNVLAAGRHPPKRTSGPDTLRYIALNANDSSGLQSVLAQARVTVVVNAAGSSQVNALEIARACIKNAVHYVDLGGDRDYSSRFGALDAEARKAGVRILTAAGAVPVLSMVLADLLAQEFDQIESVDVVYSPGNRSSGGLGSLHDLLAQIGTTFEIRQANQQQRVSNWSSPESFVFPSPVGNRRLYLFDAPDLAIFPQRYDAGTVSYRTGFELRVFNWGTSWLAWRRRQKPEREPRRYAPLLARAARRLHSMGGDHDGLGVVMSGSRDGQVIQHSAFLIGRRESSLVIPTAPATAFARRACQGGAGEAGVYPAWEVLTLDDVRDELSRHDVVLVRR